MGTILSLKWKWIYFLNIYLILDIDECIDDTQCYNNGTCINTPGSYTCNCSLGWGGSKCETGKLFCLMFHLPFVCFITIRLNLKLRFSFLNYITYRNSFLSNRCLYFIENKKGNKKIWNQPINIFIQLYFFHWLPLLQMWTSVWIPQCVTLVVSIHLGLFGVCVKQDGLENTVTKVI